MKKIYLLDTNVIMHDPTSLFAFEDNMVIIPLVVLDELDKHKTGQTQIAAHARVAIRSMDKMRSHIPQSKDYGYWRTHPFFEERVQAASVREDLLKIQEPSSADAYRKATQDVLLAYVEGPKVEPDIIELLKLEALLAWPQGPPSS